MKQHMFFQSRIATECGRALFASVGHLSRVSAAMADERVLEFETLPTHITLVRSLASVRQHVVSKRITPCKCGLALLASVFRPTRVDAAMAGERPLEFEPLPAHITLVRSLTGVC